MEKKLKEKYYSVTVPYIYEFKVSAKNKKEAINKAFSEGNGNIIGRDDSMVEVEEEI